MAAHEEGGGRGLQSFCESLDRCLDELVIDARAWTMIEFDRELIDDRAWNDDHFLSQAEVDRDSRDSVDRDSVDDRDRVESQENNGHLTGIKKQIHLCIYIQTHVKMQNKQLQNHKWNPVKFKVACLNVILRLA